MKIGFQNLHNSAVKLKSGKNESVQFHVAKCLETPKGVEMTCE